MKKKLFLIVLCSVLLFIFAQTALSKTSNAEDYFSPNTGTNPVYANPHTIPAGFVLVEGGNFIMGTPPGASYSEPDEFPTHNVHVSSFYMCIHEVTQQEYMDVMDYNPSRFVNANNPVERVNWYNAIEYCNLLSKQYHRQPVYTFTGYGTNTRQWPHNWNTYFHNNITCDWSANGFRLPTEAEFEYAARGGINQADFVYSGSNNLNDVAWYYDNTSQPHHVMTRLPNQLGIYDMTGNIQEWCWDWFANYTSAPQDNPHGPDIALFKIRRGGAWDGNYTFQRNTNRTYSYLVYGYEGMGFRIVFNAGN